MMDLNRLKTILEAYGVDPRRWPAAERQAAEALLATSGEGHAMARAAEALDHVLDRAPLTAAHTADPAILAAIVATTVPAPQRVRPSRPWSEIFAVRFAFGWPNVAALAAAGVIGFLVGWTDISHSAAASRDMLDLMAPVAAVDEPLW